jgi:hypothetical protein
MLTPAGTPPPPEPQPPESFADYGGMLLSMAAQFGSNMWQPPVASAAEGTTALEEDKVNARNTHHNSIWRRGQKASSSITSPPHAPKTEPPVKPPSQKRSHPMSSLAGETLTVRDIKSGKFPGLTSWRRQPFPVDVSVPSSNDALCAGFRRRGMLTDMAINAVWVHTSGSCCNRCESPER